MWRELCFQNGSNIQYNTTSDFKNVHTTRVTCIEIIFQPTSMSFQRVIENKWNDDCAMPQGILPQVERKWEPMIQRRSTTLLYNISSNHSEFFSILVFISNIQKRHINKSSAKKEREKKREWERKRDRKREKERKRERKRENKRESERTRENERERERKRERLIHFTIYKTKHFWKCVRRCHTRKFSLWQEVVGFSFKIPSPHWHFSTPRRLSIYAHRIVPVYDLGISIDTITHISTRSDVPVYYLGNIIIRTINHMSIHSDIPIYHLGIIYTINHTSIQAMFPYSI